MKCKKCGFNIKKGWKYCPNCSKNIHKERNIIITGLLVIILFILSVMAIAKNNTLTDSKYIKQQLEKNIMKNLMTLI